MYYLYLFLYEISRVIVAPLLKIIEIRFFFVRFWILPHLKLQISSSTILVSYNYFIFIDKIM